MPAAKKPATTRKPRTKKPEITTEETVVSNEPVLKRYYTQIFLEQMPYDLLVGTIFYSDKTGKIEIEDLDSRYASQVEGLIEGDLMLKNGKFISIVDNPKEWVIQAENGTLGFRLYAKFLTESIELELEDEE